MFGIKYLDNNVIDAKDLFSFRRHRVQVEKWRVAHGGTRHIVLRGEEALELARRHKKEREDKNL